MNGMHGMKNPFTGMNPEMMKQAETMWRMLDDMAEHNPEEYQNFVKTNIQNGFAEMKKDPNIQQDIQKIKTQFQAEQHIPTEKPKESQQEKVKKVLIQEIEEPKKITISLISTNYENKTGEVKVLVAEANSVSDIELKVAENDIKISFQPKNSSCEIFTIIPKFPIKTESLKAKFSKKLHLLTLSFNY